MAIQQPQKYGRDTHKHRKDEGSQNLTTRFTCLETNLHRQLGHQPQAIQNNGEGKERDTTDQTAYGTEMSGAPEDPLEGD
jgi:hypothetical protein